MRPNRPPVNAPGTTQSEGHAGHVELAGNAAAHYGGHKEDGNGEKPLTQADVEMPAPSPLP